MPSGTDYGDFVAGKLAARLVAGVTTGAAITASEINGASITWPTNAHRLKFVRKTRNGYEVETIGVASASQVGSTVTLGTLTRQLSLVSGSSFTSGGSGRTFPANTDVFMTWDVFDAENTVKKDISNTFTATQSLSGNGVGLKLASMTTGNQPTGEVGVIYHDATDNLYKGYTGGSYVSFTAGSVADASTTVAGKVEEATLSEISAGTAAGGTSARLFINPSHVKKNSTGAAEGNIPALNSSIALDTTIGGTGIPGGFTKGDILVATESSTLVKLPVGSNGLALVADSGETSGLKYAAVTSTNYVKDVVNSGSDSGSITHTGAAQYFTVYTYSIPANDLVSGVSYELDIAYEMTAYSSGTPTFGIYLGTTSITTVSFTPSGVGTGNIRARVSGTDVAGASKAVRANFGVKLGSQSTWSYGSANVATNGGLTLQIGVLNGTGVTSILRAGVIRRSSTTAS
jgi:hypothetical protein